MLTLNDAQWQTLLQGEARRFMATVCDGFLSGRPELRSHPGRETILARMRDAYDYATRAGFTSTPHIVWLMHLSADAPGIHDDPLVDRYLRKPGATQEQRLDDVKALIRHKLRQGNT